MLGRVKKSSQLKEKTWILSLAMFLADCAAISKSLISFEAQLSLQNAGNLTDDGE